MGLDTSTPSLIYTEMHSKIGFGQRESCRNLPRQINLLFVLSFHAETTYPNHINPLCVQNGSKTLRNLEISHYLIADC